LHFLIKDVAETVQYSLRCSAYCILYSYAILDKNLSIQWGLEDPLVMPM